VAAFLLETSALYEACKLGPGPGPAECSYNHHGNHQPSQNILSPHTDLLTPCVRSWLRACDKRTLPVPAASRWQLAMAAHHQKRTTSHLQRLHQRSAMDESTIASGSVLFATSEVDEKAASDNLQREAGCGGHLDCGDDDGGSLPLARSLLVSCRIQRLTATQ
jgi:hypothetical protein